MADMKAYWQELAKKHGLDEATSKAVLDALGNDAVTKAFTEGFVTTPDHHRRFDQEVGPLKTRNQQLEDWYQKEALPVAQQYQNSLAALRQYEATYGPLENGNGTRAAVPAGLTEAQVNKILEERMNSWSATNNMIAKTFARASAAHLKEFGEVLDFDAFEQAAIAAAQRGITPWNAYNEYVEPRMVEKRKAADTQREKDIEDRIQRQTDERVRDALSKRGVPMETAKEPSMLFLRDKAGQDKTPLEGPAAEQNAKNEFFAGWNEATSGTR